MFIKLKSYYGNRIVVHTALCRKNKIKLNDVDKIEMIEKAHILKMNNNLVEFGIYTFLQPLSNSLITYNLLKDDWATLALIFYLKKYSRRNIIRINNYNFLVI